MSLSLSRPSIGCRALLHFLAVALGWIGFAWMWVLVARRPWESQGLVLLIAGATVAMPLLTFAWVAHNRSLHRRKGHRSAVAIVAMEYAHDWHGRCVEADWALLRRSRLITIGLDGGRKVYRSVVPATREQTSAAPDVVLRSALERSDCASSPAADKAGATQEPRDLERRTA